MGAPGVNDRGFYDDALFIDAPSATVAFNGNTDPSGYRKGTGAGPHKGMASLNPGAWFVHKFDKHKGQYLALCQRAGAVTVTRDGTPPYPDTGEFGINIHRGGYNTTSSEGCQTIHPSQWESFINLAVDQAKRYHGSKWNKVVIPYILLEDQ
jgi:lysozyme